MDERIYPKKQTILNSIALMALLIVFIIGSVGFRNSYEKIRWNDWSIYDLHAEIRDIAIDKTGLIWVATFGGGLANFHDGEWSFYNTNNSEIPSDYIQSIDFDQQDRAWILVESSDVYTFDGKKWKFIIDLSSLAEFNNAGENKIVIGPDGRVWVGEWGGSLCGINLYDGHTWYRLTEENSGLSDSLNVFTLDEQGRAWIGTSQSVDVFDGTTWSNFDGFWGVGGIAFDQQGNVWVVDKKGLHVFKDGTWKTNIVKNAGDYFYPQSMAVDSLGRVWIVNSGQGIFVFEDANWTNFTRQNSPLQNNNLSHILFDQNGSLWISDFSHNIFFSRLPNPAPPLKSGMVELYNWIFSIPATITLVFLVSVLWVAHQTKLWKPVLVGIIPGLLILVLSGPPMHQEEFNQWLLVLLLGGIASLAGCAIGAMVKPVEHRPRLKITLGIVFAIVGNLLGLFLALAYTALLNYT